MKTDYLFYVNPQSISSLTEKMTWGSN